MRTRSPRLELGGAAGAAWAVWKLFCSGGTAAAGREAKLPMVDAKTAPANRQSTRVTTAARRFTSCRGRTEGTPLGPEAPAVAPLFDGLCAIPLPPFSVSPGGLAPRHPHPP